MFLKYSHQLPCEFQRRLRSLNDVHFFKVTEFHTWLLYAGPLFLRKALPEIYYHHFLLIHFSMYVFISERHEEMHDSASSCLKGYHYQIPELFGEAAYTFNNHCLMHFPMFVRKLGPLDRFSAFKFELFLYQFKKKIKTGRNVLQQEMRPTLCNSSITTGTGNKYYSQLKHP